MHSAKAYIYKRKYYTILQQTHTRKHVNRGAYCKRHAPEKDEKVGISNIKHEYDIKIGEL